ncbi:hypothetical protein GWI33_014971 [Rhynchophorus ferrugineus]|uniref:Uncharacterized protein n=1 Tax=Rhynchophorus ferrugineus TaxID=354439 RepID=A0A834MA74_RHYFE|nr:hypothetical protein GWI33_014971 [Rhynchophorus ferrugineus]
MENSPGGSRNPRITKQLSPNPALLLSRSDHRKSAALAVTNSTVGKALNLSPGLTSDKVQQGVLPPSLHPFLLVLDHPKRRPFYLRRKSGAGLVTRGRGTDLVRGLCSDAPLIRTPWRIQLEPSARLGAIDSRSILFTKKKQTKNLADVDAGSAGGVNWVSVAWR